MPVATSLQEIFVAMQLVETTELAQYPGEFQAHESVPSTVGTMPATVRFPLEGEFDVKPTTPGEKEVDTDLVGVFLIVGKRGDQAGLSALSKQAALWKNRLRDAYKLHQTLLPAGTVHRAEVKRYVFDTIEIGGVVYFGLNYQVSVRYERISPVGQ